MTEDIEKEEQAKLNAEVKGYIETIKGIGFVLWAVAALSCSVVGVTGYIVSKGLFGDLLIVVGVGAMVCLLKAEE